MQALTRAWEARWGLGSVLVPPGEVSLMALPRNHYFAKCALGN